MEKAEIESYRKAGKIAGQVVGFVRGFVKPGVLLVEIAEKIDAKIEELGAKPAFPVNLSLNEIAAHYSPPQDDETKAEGLLKVDIGVEVDGYIADTAFSLDLTKEGKYKEMIGLNEKVLEEAIKVVEEGGVGVKVGKIGSKIQELVEEHNDEHGTQFSIIKNLSGHLLGRCLVHAGLTISNYRNDNLTKLQNVAIAIEPFLTEGRGEIYEGKDSEIYMVQGSGQVRGGEARKLLEFIKEEYKTKPFCKRWLVKAGFKRLNYMLRLLVRTGVLHNFPVLIEKSKKPVSQAEHTVLIADGEVGGENTKGVLEVTTR